MAGINMILWFVTITCLCWDSCWARLSIALVDGMTETISTRIYPSRISGPDGYCVDVKDSKFRNGQSVILWPCNSNEVPNQLWTFGSDGTIRSNGMCLSTSGVTQGSKITITDCELSPLSLIIWELGHNGEIVHKVTRLVLSAIKAPVEFQLTLEVHVHSSFQTWRVDNNTQPRAVSIKTADNLCIQDDDGALILLAYCDSSAVRQRWLIYPDGTIRNGKNADRCLNYDNLIDKNVVSLSCHIAPSSQRWIITNNGTILNPRVGLVMDVKQSKEDFARVVVSPYTGDFHQKWELGNLLSAII